MFSDGDTDGWALQLWQSGFAEFAFETYLNFFEELVNSKNQAGILPCMG